MKDALDAVHASLNENNTGLDAAIAALKVALADAGQATVAMDKSFRNNERRSHRISTELFSTEFASCMEDGCPSLHDP